MTMGHQHTATILAFPGRARVSGAGMDSGARLTDKANGGTKPQRAAQPHFADSWYHQAALDEASPTRRP